MKRIAKFIFGLLTALIGVMILAWVGYSFLFPNEHFRFRIADLPRLLLPVVFIWFGWLWMRPDAPTTSKYADELTVTVKLSNSEFGTQEERNTVLKLVRILDEKLVQANIGTVDGEEFGAGECVVFIQTNARHQAEHLASAILRSKDPRIN